MADIFISYSKKHAQLTEDLARDLEAEGYTTWWDTGLLPDDVFFPETIRAEIAAAKAVIVIWAEHSIASRWVYSEATEGDKQGKLLQVRDAALDPHRAPMPFNSGNIPPVADRAKIFAALARRVIAPSNAPAAPEPLDPPPFGSTEFEKFGRRVLSEDAGKVRVMVGVAQAAREMWFAPGQSFRDLDIAPEMVVIPPGEFLMGSKDGEGSDDERPQHKVTIRQAFAVGKYPVTFDDWDVAVAARGLSHRSEGGGGRGRHPICGSWHDAQNYVNWISQKTGKRYRLLSEAEWEYVCRAGSKTAYCFGDSEEDLGHYAWHAGNSEKKTHPVGEKKPNAFGLYDMHGNVWEWCEDCRNDSYRGAPDDGSAWTFGDRSYRVRRGGSYADNPEHLRAQVRCFSDPRNQFYFNGFRLARPLDY
jgi:formylglycine-generating enzyme required for sulfatase activity